MAALLPLIGYDFTAGQLLTLVALPPARVPRERGEAVRETITFLTQSRDLSEEDAYSLASIGIDYEVSQVVDINKGVHAMIHKHLFPDGRCC